MASSTVYRDQIDAEYQKTVLKFDDSNRIAKLARTKEMDNCSLESFKVTLAPKISVQYFKLSQSLALQTTIVNAIDDSKARLSFIIE